MDIDAKALGRLFESNNSKLLAVVSSMLAERDQRLPVAYEGIVIAGSYNSTDGTVQVILGDTASNPDPHVVVPPMTCPLLTTSVGDQHGPGYVGDQRAILIHTQSGFAALLHPGPDDSPGAPLGERWITHLNTSGDVDVYDKHTNDGPTDNDELGGKDILAGGRFRVQTTNGLSAVFDDTAQTITITGNGDAVVTMNADGSITITSSEDIFLDGPVVLGSDSSGAGSPIVRKSDLQTALDSLAAIVQSGSGVTAPTATGSDNSSTV